MPKWKWLAIAHRGYLRCSRMKLSRRQTLLSLLGAGFALRCVPDSSLLPVRPRLPEQNPSTVLEPDSVYSDSVDALFDVLLPAERDGAGKLVSPGAREANADRLLRTSNFVRLALAQGLIPVLPEAAIASLSDLAGAVRTSLNRQLDALALVEKPLTPFHKLPRARQEAVVERALADDALKPVMRVMRSVAFGAYLGAGPSDAGLRAIGFPAFESVADARAVSGYPRTRAGRIVDVAHENLAALAAAGELDDYTFNLAPAPTPGDDLSLILDANGDLR